MVGDKLKTFKINNDDLVFDEFGNLEMINNYDEITQSIQRILSTNKSEWFLNTEFGLEYDQIKGKGKLTENIELAIMEAIYQDDRISEVNILEVKRNDADRTVLIKFNITVNDEIIEGIEVKI